MMCHGRFTNGMSRVSSRTLPPEIQRLLEPYAGQEIRVAPTKTDMRHERSRRVVAMRAATDPSTGRRYTTRAIALVVGITERRVVKILEHDRAREAVDG